MLREFLPSVNSACRRRPSRLQPVRRHSVSNVSSRLAIFNRSGHTQLFRAGTRAMKITGKTPCKLKKVILQGSQDSSTFHFDDSQGPPKDGIWFHVERTSAAAEAAASPVARDSAVSFSPPPQRPPPRPSNDHRKRKESVSAVGDDDDDFVGVPPRTSASRSKPTRAPVRKVKKSKSSHAGPQHSEGVQNPPKRTIPNYRCAPNKVVEAIKALKPPQKAKIRSYPFGPLLDLNLKGLENTKLLVVLMDSLDPDTLTFNFGNGKRLKITRHTIQCVLGLPNRGKRIAAPDKQKQKEALFNLKQKLGIEPGVDVKVQDLIKWIKKGDTDPFSVRCFIMILLGKLLVPGTSDYITGKEAALTEDMATLWSVNWASVIFDDIATAAKLWRSKRNASMNPYMHGCLLFLIVYYLDNLHGEHSTDPAVTPRIAHFTKQQILDLIEEDKHVVNGVETFGALPLRSQHGTCYLEDTSPSTNDPPDTRAADISSVSYSVPPVIIPSMHRHLAGCWNVFTPEQQLEADEALRRCDEDVGKLMLQIGSSQMTAIQKIMRIVGNGQPHTTPPPPPDGTDTRTANPVTAHSPLRATHMAPNTEVDPHRQSPSSHVADDPNALLQKERNIEANTDRTDDISFTQIVVGDGFDKLSSSQQAAFMDDVFGNPEVCQSPCNSPNEFPYESPHEILTNGVCKTCYDIDEACVFDEELPTEEGDADQSAADEAIASAEEETEPSCHRPQVDADAARKMASPRTPHIFRTLRNVVSDSSFRGHQTESTPLPPPVFDETPNLHHRSLTPSVDGTEHVQKVATLNKLPHIPSPVYDETPQHLTHGSKNMKQGFVSAKTLFDRPNALN